MWHRLILLSWAQAILLSWPPTVLGFQEWGTAPGHQRSFLCCKGVKRRETPTIPTLSFWLWLEWKRWKYLILDARNKYAVFCVCGGESQQKGKKMNYIRYLSWEKVNPSCHSRGKKEAEDCLNIGSILIPILHYIKLSLYSSLIYSKCWHKLVCLLFFDISVSLELCISIWNEVYEAKAFFH